MHIGQSYYLHLTRVNLLSSDLLIPLPNLLTLTGRPNKSTTATYYRYCLGLSNLLLLYNCFFECPQQQPTRHLSMTSV